MPGGSRALIVGGGIDGVAPLVIDNFLFLTSITPPLASTSPRLIRRATSIEVLGDGALSTAIGNGTDVDQANSVGIGRTIANSSVAAPASTMVGDTLTQTAGGNNNVVLGQGINARGGVSQVLIGSGSPAAAVNNVVCIGGAACSVSAGANGVNVGNGSTQTGSNATAIGTSASAGTGGTALGNAAAAINSNNICIGSANDTTGSSSGNLSIGGSNRLTNLSNVIFLGHNLRTDTGTFAAGDVVIGNNNLGGGGFSSRVVWFGDTHTSGTAVPAAAMRWKNAAGTDIAAGSLTVTAPRATGNAVSGSIILQTSPAGASGAALQTATTRLTISPNGVVTLAAPTVAAENLVIDGSGGAGQGSIRLNNLTNGAGAAAGTLANAPSAGDPSFWIPVSIGGLARFIPAWT